VDGDESISFTPWPLHSPGKERKNLFPLIIIHNRMHTMKKERTISTHLIRSWVVPRDILDPVEKRMNSFQKSKSDSLFAQPLA
jgi:hypothetical protein